MATGERKIGEFCWLNVLTPDPAAAQQFFASLLDWQYVEIPGMGHRVQVDGHDIGGMWDLNGPNTPSGTPPGIGVMVRVTNAGETSARANELGGTGKPPMEVGPPGTMAELYDPNGANIDVWQSGASPGSTADPLRHGVPSWFESVTTDVPKAVAFYTALFGWSARGESVPGFDYTTFRLGETPVAGMMPISPDWGEVPPHWGVYITVDDVDATVAKAQSLGASVMVPAQDVETVGRFSGLVSPQGVMFYVIRYSEPQA
jgi:predicted enzyme related to lactoylglutathione lyase